LIYSGFILFGIIHYFFLIICSINGVDIRKKEKKKILSQEPYKNVKDPESPDIYVRTTDPDFLPLGCIYIIVES